MRATVVIILFFGLLFSWVPHVWLYLPKEKDLGIDKTRFWRTDAACCEANRHKHKIAILLTQMLIVI